jgi:hypothetical protein
MAERGFRWRGATHYLKKLTVAGMNRMMTAHVKGCKRVGC